ncbi:MAG: helix-turn-helix domain-containing protein [Clostridia bacterium]|nr:helix-turn-helix domain-containing protein [Clostridia bacterium]
MIYDCIIPYELKIPDIEVLSHKQMNGFTIINATDAALSHHHIFFEILYVVKGTVYHSVNGSSKEAMHEGDFVFIDIGTIHEYNSYNANILNIIFTPQFIDKNMQFCFSITELFKRKAFNPETPAISFPADTVLHDTDGTLLNIIMFLKSKFENPQILSYTIMRHGIISMLMHILEPQYLRQKSVSNITESLLKMIDAHYTEQNLLTRAANKINYTIPHISATFKKDLGISFKEYLQMYRINQAKHLLDTSDMSISEVSYAVGYSDVRFFRSTFKKITNATPSQYRRSSCDHSDVHSENLSKTTGSAY